MRYRYQALGPRGDALEGLVDAPDERAAAAALKARALFVRSLARADAPAPRRRLRRRAAPRASRLAFFFRELALMLRSGVTLLHALEVGAGQSRDPGRAALAARVAERIRAGRSLSQAFAAEPGVPRLAVRLVESGEATGELDPVLDRIADVVERRATLRRNLLTSLAYPAIVLVVALAVAVFLVVGIVPKFAAFFARRGVALPATTQALLDVSVWMREHGLGLAAAGAVLGAAGTVVHFTRRGRVLLHRAALSVPVAGRLWQVASFAQVAWTLGGLLRSGVGLLESIRITAASLPNRALGEHLAGVADRVLGGETLARGLDHALVPPVVASLVAAGEQSGAMTEVLGELARYYESDLELRIRRMSSLVEPALILVVGGLVGFVYLAFFQALMQLAQR